MSFAAVRAWRELLRSADPAPGRGPLSVQGAREAWDVALAAWTDEALAAAAAIEGEPYRTAAVVCARTVATAPLEWCAVLLGRGAEVVWKHPTDDPGLSGLCVQAARTVGLPLVATADRAAVRSSELVVAMGRDDTIDRLAAEVSGRLLGFGHRTSTAWITRAEGFWGVARDAALHDSRGCMSPAIVYTPLPWNEAADALAEAMEAAERRWPRGEVTPTEAALIRSRRAGARVADRLREGAAWSVHGGTTTSVSALPRSLLLRQAPDRAAFEAAITPMLPFLSTVGTDDPALRLRGVRCCSPGEMQRPPLVRLHDGVDWLRATLR